VKVATHDRGANSDYTFYNPTSHPFFDDEGGRFVYFEGTYTNTFSGNSTQTPLYDYNQIMYRLDLATIPNLFPRLGGDFNQDGVVDSADYIVWRKTLGSELYLAADASRSGMVDVADYEYWRANFALADLGAGQAQPVPAPESWSLLAVAALGLVLSSCYRQR